MRVWLLALGIKTVLGVALPLSNDESYYWVWGNMPQLSYFDHPPMVGWLFWFGTFLDFFGNAARLPGVWLGHATLLIWQQILKPYINETQAKFWLIFVLFSPFVGAGSLIVTPDIPLLFFWSLSLLILLKLVKTPNPKLYAALGASLGLGFCSKYLIVLFVPIALLWLLWSKSWRQVRWAYVPLTIIAGLIFCLPVIYWNYQNEWASFIFQINHGLKSQTRSLAWPFEYLGGQFLLLFPTVIWLALKRREPSEASFLHFFGWLPIAFFFYTAFKAPVEANWPMMGHPAVLSLAILNATEKNLKTLKATIAIWFVLLALIISEIMHPWIPVEPRHKKTSEFTRYDAFLAEAEKDPNFYLGSYQMAGDISYKTRRQIYKLGGMNRRDFYDFLSQSIPTSDTFSVGSEIGHQLPTWVIEKGYEVVNIRALNGELQVIEVRRRAQSAE